jgi:hypothetical protein
MEPHLGDQKQKQQNRSAYAGQQIQIMRAGRGWKHGPIIP